ncbi:MAG: iron-sulfur cluster assembly protein [Tannerella sp.]|jgi:FeS assembly SUF system protein|nr:iron-sulfur cluster assembly protein [Tannerella sp.]
MENEFLKTEEEVIKALRSVYDPEIPVNVYDLGLVYNVDVGDGGDVVIEMTFTSPNCPAADFITEDVCMRLSGIEGVGSVRVNLVFEPEWNKDMMTDEAKLELGLL